MKSFLVLVMSLFAPGLGQISMGRKKLGFSFLSLLVLLYFATKFILINKVIFLTTNGLLWFFYVSPTFILAWDHFKNKKPLFTSKIKFKYLILIYSIFVITCVLISKKSLNIVYKIPNASMAPLIKKGDYVVIKKTTPILPDLPMRGKVIAFKLPNENIVYIKRLMGLPGDEIKVINNKISINGSEVPQSKYPYDFKGKINLYIDRPTDSSYRLHVWQEEFIKEIYLVMTNENIPSHDQENYIVPEGHVYVLGDNRSSSKDSRHIHAIPIENIIGYFKYVLD